MNVHRKTDGDIAETLGLDKTSSSRMRGWRTLALAGLAVLVLAAGYYLFFAGGSETGSVRYTTQAAKRGR